MDRSGSRRKGPEDTFITEQGYGRLVAGNGTRVSISNGRVGYVEMVFVGASTSSVARRLLADQVVEREGTSGRIDRRFANRPSYTAFCAPLLRGSGVHRDRPARGHSTEGRRELRPVATGMTVGLGATLGGLAPGPSAAVQRLMGASRLSQQLAEGQRKRSAEGPNSAALAHGIYLRTPASCSVPAVAWVDDVSSSRAGPGRSRGSVPGRPRTLAGGSPSGSPPQ